MNFLVLSKIYNILENNNQECENNQLIIVKANNYNELEKTLINHNYDYIPEEILISIKNGSVTEEALARPNSLVLTCDDTIIEYPGTQFLIKKFCTEKAVIEVKDDKKYCEKCFQKINKQVNFSKIKSILSSQDEMNGLSTSQKIEYILIKNSGKKLSASQIYDIGEPWDLKTFTPRNSVFARTSSLFNNGIIKRDGVLYYV
jgi:hypothetical protein